MTQFGFYSKPKIPIRTFDPRLVEKGRKELLSIFRYAGWNPGGPAYRWMWGWDNLEDIGRILEEEK